MQVLTARLAKQALATENATGQAKVNKALAGFRQKLFCS